jgi:hypothetical protein
MKRKINKKNGAENMRVGQAWKAHIALKALAKIDKRKLKPKNKEAA